MKIFNREIEFNYKNISEELLYEFEEKLFNERIISIYANLLNLKN